MLVKMQKNLHLSYTAGKKQKKKYSLSGKGKAVS